MASSVDVAFPTREARTFCAHQRYVLAMVRDRVHRAPEPFRETLSTACAVEIDERGVLVVEPQPQPVSDEADHDHTS